MNKRKKVNLSSIFMLAMLMACLVLFMVISLRKNQDISFKGGISYQVDNIDAKVTGSVSGSSKKVSLANLNFDSNTNIEKEESKWENKSLYFNKKKNEASIVFTVTNNSSTDNLYFVIKDNNSNIENVSTNILKLSSTEASKEYNYTDDFITIPVDDSLTEEKENIVSFKLDFKVEDLKAGIKKDTKWNYEITLTSESPIKTVEYYKTLEYGALDFKLNSYEMTAEVKSYIVDKVSLTKGDVQIPSYVKDDSGKVYKVTKIPTGAFFMSESVTSVPAKNMTSVTLPSTITTINNSAFSDCVNLQSVKLNEGLTTIEGHAFGKTNIKEIFIPSTVTSIHNRAFVSFSLVTSDFTKELNNIEVHKENTVYDSRDNCNALIETATNKLVVGTNSSTIPEDIEIIGENAFRDCANINEIELPSTLKEIQQYAFSGCTSLKGELIVPEGVKTIGGQAFTNTNYNKISLPGTLEKCNIETAFDKNKLDNIKISDANRVYDSRYDCNAIIDSETNTLLIGCNNTVIPYDIVSISSNALNSCNKLKEVVIPEGVKNVGTNAFYGCNSLTSLHIPSTLQTIGENAFAICGFDYISVAEGNTVYDSRNNCNALIETSTNKLLVGSSNTIIPSEITSISTYAFQGCKNLTQVTIPESVTVIETKTFNDCVNLQNVNLSEVTTISDYAFYGCEKLQEITIPATVTEIKLFAFGNCFALNSIVVEEGNTVYDSRNNCNAIIKTETNELLQASNSTNVIPNTVVSISSNAFRSCKYLESVTIPASVTSIGISYSNSNIFENCDKLSSIQVSAANTVFDSRDNCNAIIVSETNTLISGCKNTTIPSSVTALADNSMAGIVGLRSIVIPASVTTIGTGVFRRCKNLQTIKLMSTTPPVLDILGLLDLVIYPFEDSVRVIRVPKASLEAYKTADVWKLYADKIVGF